MIMSKQGSTGKRLWSLLLAIGLTASVAACGGSSTATTDGTETTAASNGTVTTSADGGQSDFEAQAEESRAALEAIMNEVAGLSLEDRQARLIELAQEEAQEGRPLTLYTGGSFAEDLIDRFSEIADFDVVLLSPGGNAATATRLIEEMNAGYNGADVTFVSDQWIEGPDGLASMGLFHTIPADNPYRSQIMDIAQGETWIAGYLNVSVPVYNSDTVTDTSGPTTWAEYLGPNFAGNPDFVAAWEAEEAQWMGSVVEILVEEGMTEEDAIELFMEAGRNGFFSVGSTVGITHVASGQVDMHNNVNWHGIQREQFVDAPLRWEPTPEPVLFYTNGAAIVANTPNPAGALALLEFLLGDEGQQLMAETGRTPADPEVVSNLSFPDETYELRRYSDQVLLDLDKWEELWQAVINQN